MSDDKKILAYIGIMIVVVIHVLIMTDFNHRIDWAREEVEEGLDKIAFQSERAYETAVFLRDNTLLYVDTDTMTNESGVVLEENYFVFKGRTIKIVTEKKDSQ